jgi:hypothetical protein
MALDDFVYDEATDVVRALGVEGFPPVIEVENAKGPLTKKCDIEKGEDNKDRRMWK